MYPCRTVMDLVRAPRNDYIGFLQYPHRASLWRCILLQQAWGKSGPLNNLTQYRTLVQLESY